MKLPTEPGEKATAHLAPLLLARILAAAATAPAAAAGALLLLSLLLPRRACFEVVHVFANIAPTAPTQIQLHKELRRLCVSRWKVLTNYVMKWSSPVDGVIQANGVSGVVAGLPWDASGIG